MAKMFTLLFLPLLGLTAAVNECPGATCEPATSWTEEDDVHGLELLQLRGTQTARRNCPVPAVDKYDLDAGKDCAHGAEPPPGEDEICLAGDHAYQYLNEAWKACGQNPKCGAVMETPNGQFKLRRAGDPDRKGHGEKLYKYECEGAVQESEKTQAAIKQHGNSALLQVEPKKPEVNVPIKLAEDNGCTFPDLASYRAVAKGCPHKGACLEQNRGYKTLPEAWEACALSEFCGAVLQHSDGIFYLRRESDPDVEDPKAKLYAYNCKKNVFKKKAIDEQAKAMAAEMLKQVEPLEKFKEKAEVHEVKSQLKAVERQEKEMLDQQFNTEAQKIAEAQKKLQDIEKAAKRDFKAEKEEEKELEGAQKKLKAATRTAAKEEKLLEKYKKDLIREKAVEEKEAKEAELLDEARKRLAIATEAAADAEKLEKHAQSEAHEFTITVPEQVKELQKKAKADEAEEKRLVAKEKEDRERLEHLQQQLNARVGKEETRSPQKLEEPPTLKKESISVEKPEETTKDEGSISPEKQEEPSLDNKSPSPEKPVEPKLDDGSILPEKPDQPAVDAESISPEKAEEPRLDSGSPSPEQPEQTQSDDGSALPEKSDQPAVDTGSVSPEKPEADHPAVDTESVSPEKPEEPRLVEGSILPEEKAKEEVNDPDECLDVEDPVGAAAEGKAGDRQCFESDQLGMVCGWDRMADEAYCELSPNGLKVCARRRGGGRCKAGKNTPITTKAHDKEPHVEAGAIFPELPLTSNEGSTFPAAPAKPTVEEGNLFPTLA